MTGVDGPASDLAESLSYADPDPTPPHGITRPRVVKCSHCNGTGIEPPASLELAVPDGPDRFDEFWTLYGRVGPKKKAKECFDAAVRRGHSPSTIVAGLARWVEYWDTPGAAAMKWPQGFLNQEYFLDEPPQIRGTVERKTMPGRSGIEAALANRRRDEIGSGQ